MSKFSLKKACWPIEEGLLAFVNKLYFEKGSSSKATKKQNHRDSAIGMMAMKWCLMLSDAGRHISLRPMPKHG